MYNKYKNLFALSNVFCGELSKLVPKFGFGKFGEVVYYRTYSRIKEDGSQEHWHDTVIRVVNGIMSIRKGYYIMHNLPWNETKMQIFAQDMATYMFQMKFLPSGRNLWAMGTEYMFERGSASLFNCGFVTTKDLADSCEWTADMLMCGCGVGFDAEWDGIAFNPRKSRIVTFEIPDSREGWALSVRKHIESYTVKGSPMYIFDYSKIRKKGSPIRGFGGVASGPDPLIKLHERIDSTFIKYLDGKIDKTRAAVDIMNSIGICVVSGNVRRSAMIALGNLEDDTFINLKNYDKFPDRREIGWMSNNSVVLKKTEDFLNLPQIVERILNNGEPGVINLLNIQKFGRVRYGEEKSDKAIGINPCVTGDTLVMTTHGLQYVHNLVGKSFTAIVNGEEYASTDRGFWNTGVKKVYTVKLQNGMKLRATENHPILVKKSSNQYRWTEIKNILIGNKVMLSNNAGYRWYGGEGSYNEGYSYDIQSNLKIERRSYSFTIGLLSRFFRANGKILNRSIILTQSMEMLQIIQNLLSSIGIWSAIRDSEIIIPESESSKFMCVIGYINKLPKTHKNVKFISEVESIILCKNEETVYDCSIPIINAFAAQGLIVHNCGEEPLEHKETCNLTEVFPTKCSTKEEYLNALTFATFYASTVSLFPTHHPETNKVMFRNRRIGISLSGITDWLEDIGCCKMIRLLRDGYRHIEAYNRELADEAGVPVSIRLTTVKPSGTISLLVGVSSGMNFPTFKYAIRRIRIAQNSKICKILTDANIPNEPDKYSVNTQVFEFPIDQGKTRKAADVSVWEQFTLLSTLQREWSDSSVSCTVYFDKEKEGSQLEHVLSQFIPVIKSVSLLPHSMEGAYEQMPYEGITKEEYQRRVESIQDINWKLFSGSDGIDTRYCTNDTCSI